MLIILEVLDVYVMHILLRKTEKNLMRRQGSVSCWEYFLTEMYILFNELRSGIDDDSQPQKSESRIA